ncbi:MAG: type I DNA topoisomerase [Rickettsiales bacterium]|jgi:DNA topoisomerase-1|nr:type I DNA topoisomerase [Rickettsiales bacterium]
MNILIVESPGKVKKIQGFLNSSWKVVASVGHVRDLPSHEIGVSPPDFKPLYKETDKGKKVLSNLKTLISKNDTVYLATDPDREGEAIAWHLQDSLSLKNPLRVTYTEITESAVKRAIENPGSIDMNLVHAQECRRVLDRLVGFNVSPALSNVMGQALSAGRVQTPSLRLIVEREQAIRDFKQTTHYGVDLFFDVIEGISDGWKAIWNTKNFLEEDNQFFLDKSVAEQIASLRYFTVSSYVEGETPQAPAPPFTTSTLQQAASTYLKLDPKQTMEIAQKLYESGHITYMRTDSPNLSDDAIANIRSIASKKDLTVPPKPRIFKSKQGAQEAHEAIRPTHFEIESLGDSDNEKALYNLIWIRSFASQLEDAVFSTTKVVLISDFSGKEVIFNATGRNLIKKGFKDILKEDMEEKTDLPDSNEELTNKIPKLREGSEIIPSKSEVKTKKTTPPPRYTQATLIKELEKRGIGRPSTYASILDNILTRNYIFSNKKRQLEATPLGENLICTIPKNISFIDYDFTKKLESLLDEIALGKNDYLTVVKDFYQSLDTELKSFLSANTPSCSDCGSMLIHFKGTKNSKNYNFWACSNKEQCGAKYNDDNGKPGTKQIPFPLSDFTCSVCGQKLRNIVKDGDNGYNFWACSNKECSSTFKNDDGKPGELNKKASKSEPVSKYKCSKCKSPLYHKTGVSQRTGGDYNFFVCSNKTCKMTFSSSNDNTPIFENPKINGKK